MTVAALPSFAEYLEDGATLSFPVPFRFKAPTDLVVERIIEGDVFALKLGVDYSVTGGTTDAGGAVMRSTPGSGAILRIRRRTARAQPMVYTTGDRFPAVSHEEALDRQMLISQEQDSDLADTTARALLVPAGEIAVDIPNAIERADSALVFDSRGIPIAKPIGSFPAGPPGGSDNTYSSRVKLLASDPTRKSARLVGDTDFPATPDGNWNFVAGTGWIPQQVNGVGYGRKPNIALPADKSLPRTLAFMGVDPYTILGQTDAIIHAFADATGDRLKLIGHPDARYAKEAPIPIGYDFDGQGCTFVGSGTSNAIQLTGAGRTYKNFTTLGAATLRTSVDSADGGIYVTATDFVLDNVVASRVEEGRGHGAAALFFAGAKRGVIRNSQALYSKADGHHCSDGCEDLLFYNPTSIGVEDDGFAVVSYDYQGTINKRIHTVGLRAVDVRARGLSVLGCLDGVHKNPSIIRSSGAAIYLVSEGADSFNTLGSRGIRIEGLYAEYCVTGINRPMLAQAIILVVGRDGVVNLADGSKAPLSISDWFVGGRVVGAGSVASYALRTDSAANLRGGYDLVLQDISGPFTADACVQLGGQDGYGRIVIEGCDGYPFLFMPSMTGDHSYDTLQAVSARRKSPNINEAFHGSGANNWSSLHIDLAKFPDATITPAGNMDLNKLTWRRFLVAGKVIAHP